VAADPRKGMLRRALGRRRPVLPRHAARVPTARAVRPARQARMRRRASQPGPPHARIPRVTDRCSGRRRAPSIGVAARGLGQIRSPRRPPLLMLAWSG
jgi:hypothetical protein